MAQGRASRLLEALLGAFEPKGVAAAESLAERLEASRGRLEASSGELPRMQCSIRWVW